MQLIHSPSAGGYEIQVDDEDYAYLSQYKWYVDTVSGRVFSIVRQRPTQILYMNREVLSRKLGRALLSWIQEQADHEDFNRLNNQRYNLRLSTPVENTAHRRKQRGTNTSRYKGVCFIEDRTKWRASISIMGKQVYMHFETELEAALWYDQMARQLHGEFARTNFE